VARRIEARCALADRGFAVRTPRRGLPRRNPRRQPAKESIMPSITREIVVTAPLRLVYDAWVQFESYPQFMEGVEEVALLDAKRLRWRSRDSNGGGEAGEWEVAITEQAPDDRIRWEATAGPVRAGAVMVDALAEGKTRVRMELDIEAARDDEEEIAMRAERDLHAFKGYIEARASQTSGWSTPPAPERAS
jgi:uncharacterized membrane protein